MKVKYQWGERHAIVLHNFLVELNGRGIKYFILRNYEGLPEENNSKDIDLIICPGQYREASEILLNTLKQNNVPNYYVVKFERAHCWIGIDVDNDFFIHIDLIEGYLNKGFEIFPFDELYGNTIPFKDYKVLSAKYDAVMLLLYKVIGCRELKQKYREKISQIVKDDETDILGILKKIFNKRLAESVNVHLLEEDYDWIVDNAKALSRNSKLKAFIRRPIHTLINVSNFLLEKSIRIIICPKKMRRMVVVEAPDGTGKTTFIDLLCVKLAECFVTDISKMHVYHFRPTYLPNLGELGEKAGVMKQDRDFTNPHRGKKTNQLSSLIRVFYYWLDYVFGGIIAIRKDVQFDKFTIFDRYVYDFLVDPKRSKINLPYSLRKLFTKMVPQPQITFVLDADAEVIYSRKQELTIDEIRRQLVEFRKLDRIANGYVKLDSNKTPEEIVDRALHIIIKKFAFEV